MLVRVGVGVAVRVGVGVRVEVGVRVRVDVHVAVGVLPWARAWLVNPWISLDQGANTRAAANSAGVAQRTHVAGDRGGTRTR